MKKYLLKDALQNKYAIGAFNFASLETLKAIIRAAEDEKSPVIAQVSEGAIKFIGTDYLKDFILTTKKHCSVPVLFHLDHGSSLESVKLAIKLGCDSVMIDASMLPFAENVKVTKKIVNYAHKYGVFVEGELGSLAGIEDGINVSDKDSCYTSPLQAKDFVQLTGIDSLAIAIGTKHGAYKYSGDATLRLDILKKIQKEIPSVPLVLHGASSVANEDVEKLYSFGVNIKGAKGVSNDLLKKVAKMNICKINGDTDLRISFLNGVLEDIKANPTNIDYRKYLSSGMNQVYQKVVEKIKLYGSKNRVK